MGYYMGQEFAKAVIVIGALGIIGLLIKGLGYLSYRGAAKEDRDMEERSFRKGFAKKENKHE